VANGPLKFKVSTISHFALAERDVAIAKLNQRSKLLFVCKLTLAERNHSKMRGLILRVMVEYCLGTLKHPRHIKYTTLDP